LQETYCISSTQANWFMLFSKMIALCCEGYTRQYERQTEVLDVEINDI